MPITEQIDSDIYKRLTPIPSPAEQEAEQLKLSEARAKRQQVIEAAQDQAAVRAALQANLGDDGAPDYDAAIRSLAPTNARAATALQDLQGKIREQQFKAQSEQYKADKAQNDHIVAITQGLNADNYAAIFPLLPKELQDKLGETYDPQKVKWVQSTGLSASEFTTAQEKSLDHYLKGDYRKAIAEQVALHPEMQDAILKDARDNWNVPLGVIQQFQAVPPEQRQAFAQDAALTEDQRATNREQASTREQTVANQAATREDTAAYRAAQLAQGQQRIGLEAQRLKQSASGSAASGGGAGSNDAKDIAEGIMRGEQPPITTGLYRNAAAVRAELARQHYPLAKATEDWTATQKYLGTLNGAQQTRLRQAISFTSSSLDLVDDLAKQWDAGGFPLLNSVTLATAKNGGLGPKAQAVATKLSAQIADLTSELGTVYKGGNSSTDESLKLAAQNLQTNWSKPTMLANIKQIRENLRIRQNSMSLGVAGTNPGNAYAPPGTNTQPDEGKSVTTAELSAIAKKRGTTVEQEKARASAAGYTVK